MFDGFDADASLRLAPGASLLLGFHGVFQLFFWPYVVSVQVPLSTGDVVGP